MEYQFKIELLFSVLTVTNIVVIVRASFFMGDLTRKVDTHDLSIKSNHKEFKEFKDRFIQPAKKDH